MSEGAQSTWGRNRESVREDGFGLPVWVVHGESLDWKGIGSVAKIIDRNHATDLESKPFHRRCFR